MVKAQTQALPPAPLSLYLVLISTMTSWHAESAEVWEEAGLCLWRGGEEGRRASPGSQSAFLFS